MLVDDEASLVKMQSLLLERLGYRVAPYLNPLEALEAFRNDPHGFDLIITDMAMPDMSGAHLIRKLIAVRPDIKTVLCTGWIDQADEARATDAGVEAFLVKPIENEAFARTVRQVLDKGGAGL
jgi:CheY-like chemotaxis protein